MEEKIIVDQPQNQDIPPVPHVPLKHKSSFKSFFGIFLSVFLLISLAIVVFISKKPQEIRKKASGNGVTIALTPATKTVKINDTFSLGITISASSAQKVSAAQISIDYDTTAIDVTNVSIGSALTVPLIPVAMSNGKITMTLGAVPANPPTAPSGSFIVATVTAKAKKAGTTALNFTSTTNANIVTVLFITTNALSTTTGSTITIQALPTNTPIPTIKPTNTPIPTIKPTNTPIPTPIVTKTPGTTPTGVPQLLGDITGEEGIPDGIVNLFDYSNVVEHYNEKGTPGFIRADIIGEEGIPDGIVDLFDLNVVVEHYGERK